MVFEVSRSTAPNTLPFWQSCSIGSLSVVLLAGVAQAQPKQVPQPDGQSLQRVIDHEQAQLADTRLFDSAVFAPSSSVAAAPTKQYLPTQPNQPAYASEDDLIQQMTGKAAPTRPQTPPVLAPLPSSAAPFQPAAAVPVQPGSTPPVFVTTGSNSDVNVGLFSPATPCSSAACSGGVESAQQPPGLVPVPPPLATGQSTPLPPAPIAPANPVDPTLDLSTQGVPQVQPVQPQQVQPTTRPEPSTPPPSRRGLLRSTALSAPSIRLQGVYVYQGDDSSARARLSISYPLTPRWLFGATFDLTDGNAFSDSRDQGFSVNELYLATSPAGLPNLRFVVGQLDLTSYFDRNSFAKDGATHFFNPIFQTNPALAASGIRSTPAALVNWSLTDNIEAKAAVFSSSRSITDFSLDGFAGELGIRYGNLIVRGTYVTDRDAGNRDGFREIFQIDRGGGDFGIERGDREEAYGINAEYYVPQLKMGIFARYGRYNNLEIDRGGDTYSAGISFLDVFAPDDRLGIAYGRGLSNETLRRRSGDETPDVLEAFYDFRFLPNLRLGFTIQQRNDFSETILGVRVKTEFDVTPAGRPF